jgi:hypothetical protein
LKELHLYSKCFWIQRVFVVALLWAAEIAFVALSRACFMRFCLVLILVFGFWFDWGRHRRSSLSIPHTLQVTASAPKDASRFRHLWFIFLIWKYWVSAVSVFGYSVFLSLHCFGLLRLRLLH